jgi:hypothetical protein
LLLLAAAAETGLITGLSEALPTEVAPARPPLVNSSDAVRQRLLLTLLFLGVVGLHRSWDLRSYTADGLALLTGRRRAYGYRYTEAFLSQVAHTDGAERLTDALARWTMHLWHSSEEGTEPFTVLRGYVDGHSKPVYSSVLIPRGLIGRLGVILGCRALVLLHDEQGHPLLVLTYRGGQHLTVGLPAIVTRYEQAVERVQVSQIIVDREGMATEFLASLQESGRTVVTILRTNQYRDQTSFTEIGAFVPLTTDAKGNVLREVAPARIVLQRPEHPGKVLSLRVALIRDLRRMVVIQPSPEEAASLPAWDADQEADSPRWCEDGWQATAAPAPAMTDKLIPIVSTADEADAVELAQTYIRRWAVQENVIKDYLRPLGLDINHGFAKTEVPNSEVTKERSKLEKRQARLQQWARSAHHRLDQTKERYTRLQANFDLLCQKLSRQLGWYQAVPPPCTGADPLLYQEIEERNAKLDKLLRPTRDRLRKLEEQRQQDWEKLERYCQEQRKVLRALEDLSAKERKMYELDNRKDQVMTVCKVAMANLAMWVRDQYFPPSYAHATWLRLLPFFQLPGTVTCNATTIQVQLSPFNDRSLNRDLVQLCERVNSASPCLPDGRQLSFTIGSNRCVLPAHKGVQIT